MTENESAQELACPFCGETGFDAPGLKGHIKNGDCDECEKVENTHRIRFY